MAALLDFLTCSDTYDALYIDAIASSMNLFSKKRLDDQK